MMTMSAVEYKSRRGGLPWRPQRWSCLREGKGGEGGGILESPLVTPMSWGGDFCLPLFWCYLTENLESFRVVDKQVESS